MRGAAASAHMASLGSLSFGIALACIRLHPWWQPWCNIRVQRLRPPELALWRYPQVRCLTCPVLAWSTMSGARRHLRKHAIISVPAGHAQCTHESESTGAMAEAVATHLLSWGGARRAARVSWRQWLGRLV